MGNDGKMVSTAGKEAVLFVVVLQRQERTRWPLGEWAQGRQCRWDMAGGAYADLWGWVEAQAAEGAAIRGRTRWQSGQRGG